jgi:hypothetical protein
MKQSFRALPNFSEQKHVNVDRENDLIKNIEIAKYGRNKNASFFDDKFLQDLAKKGSEATQGVKSRFGHPNMCANSLGTYVGRYKNWTFKDQKVYADLFLDPISKKTEVEGKGIKMYDYIMDMAESNSDMFGNSIVIMADDYQNEIENEAGEMKMETVKVIQSLLASDLVDDPAATDALFSVNKEDFGLVMTEFLDDNPQFFETEPDIIVDFIDRYVNYNNRKSNKLNMSILEKMKAKFSKNKVDETFDVDLTLATGDIITVVTEDEQPKVGDAVNDAEGSAVQDGDHLLADGSTIVTVGGLITEIKEAEEEEVPADDEADDANFAALNKKFDSFAKDVTDTLTLISDKFNAQEKRISNLQKTVKSKSFSVPSKADRKGIKSEGEEDFASKIASQREAREDAKKK